MVFIYSWIIKKHIRKVQKIITETLMLRKGAPNTFLSEKHKNIVCLNVCCVMML